MVALTVNSSSEESSGSGSGSGTGTSTQASSTAIPTYNASLDEAKSLAREYYNSSVTPKTGMVPTLDTDAGYNPDSGTAIEGGVFKRAGTSFTVTQYTAARTALVNAVAAIVNLLSIPETQTLTYETTVTIQTNYDTINNNLQIINEQYEIMDTEYKEAYGHIFDNIAVPSLFKEPTLGQDIDPSLTSVTAFSDDDILNDNGSTTNGVNITNIKKQYYLETDYENYKNALKTNITSLQKQVSMDLMFCDTLIEMYNYTSSTETLSLNINPSCWNTGIGDINTATNSSSIFYTNTLAKVNSDTIISGWFYTQEFYNTLVSYTTATSADTTNTTDALKSNANYLIGKTNYIVDFFNMIIKSANALYSAGQRIPSMDYYEIYISRFLSKVRYEDARMNFGAGAYKLRGTEGRPSDTDYDTTTQFFGSVNDSDFKRVIMSLFYNIFGSSGDITNSYKDEVAQMMKEKLHTFKASNNYVVRDDGRPGGSFFSKTTNAGSERSIDPIISYSWDPDHVAEYKYLKTNSMPNYTSPYRSAAVQLFHIVGDIDQYGSNDSFTYPYFSPKTPQVMIKSVTESDGTYFSFTQNYDTMVDELNEKYYLPDFTRSIVYTKYSDTSVGSGEGHYFKNWWVFHDVFKWVVKNDGGGVVNTGSLKGWIMDTEIPALWRDDLYENVDAWGDYVMLVLYKNLIYNENKLGTRLIKVLNNYLNQIDYSIDSYDTNTTSLGYNITRLTTTTITTTTATTDEEPTTTTTVTSEPPALGVEDGTATTTVTTTATTTRAANGTVTITTVTTTESNGTVTTTESTTTTTSISGAAYETVTTVTKVTTVTTAKQSASLNLDDQNTDNGYITMTMDDLIRIVKIRQLTNGNKNVDNRNLLRQTSYNLQEYNINPYLETLYNGDMTNTIFNAQALANKCTISSAYKTEALTPDYSKIKYELTDANKKITIRRREDDHGDCVYIDFNLTGETYDIATLNTALFNKLDANNYYYIVGSSYNPNNDRYNYDKENYAMYTRTINGELRMYHAYFSYKTTTSDGITTTTTTSDGITTITITTTSDGKSTNTNTTTSNGIITTTTTSDGTLTTTSDGTTTTTSDGTITTTSDGTTTTTSNGITTTTTDGTITITTTNNGITTTTTDGTTTTTSNGTITTTTTTTIDGRAITTSNVVTTITSIYQLITSPIGHDSTPQYLTRASGFLVPNKVYNPLILSSGIFDLPVATNDRYKKTPPTIVVLSSDINSNNNLQGKQNSVVNSAIIAAIINYATLIVNLDSEYFIMLNNLDVLYDATTDTTTKDKITDLKNIRENSNATGYNNLGNGISYGIADTTKQEQGVRNDADYLLSYYGSTVDRTKYTDIYDSTAFAERCNQMQQTKSVYESLNTTLKDAISLNLTDILNFTKTTMYIMNEDINEKYDALYAYNASDANIANALSVRNIVNGYNSTISTLVTNYNNSNPKSITPTDLNTIINDFNDAANNQLPDMDGYLLGSAVSGSETGAEKIYALMLTIKNYVNAKNNIIQTSTTSTGESSYSSSNKTEAANLNTDVNETYNEATAIMVATTGTWYTSVNTRLTQFISMNNKYEQMLSDQQQIDTYQPI
jgi:hypothetical protein